MYETSPTVKIGFKRLKSWLNSARIIFGKAVHSIENYLVEISHYFVSKTTSGVMEGINNRIKLIIRQSYGFKSFESLREKLLACLFK
ncbi:transposase [Trichocoleus sp. FACHB-90]|uniref:transposase n=1 Tax=Cyanophyceae TaxID=3028117 RepID=UPI0032203A22